MVKMKVKIVGMDQNTMIPVVVITDTEEKGFIPILIGHAEAAAILSELEGTRPQRPMTHDLMKNMVDTLGAKIDRVVICDLKDETYFARIIVKTANGEQELDARPSDAIALALRAGADVYVSEEVAARALIANKPIDDREMEEFRKFLEDVKPEDFQKNFRKE